MPGSPSGGRRLAARLRRSRRPAGGAGQKPTTTGLAAATLRSSPSASTIRPTASGSGAASACTCTSSRWRRGRCRQLTERRLGRRRAGLVAGREAARLPGAAMAPDRDLVFSLPVYVVAADGSTDPQPVALVDSAGSRGQPGLRTVSGLLAVAMDPDKGDGRARPSDAGRARQWRRSAISPASLDRNVMPGGPGYPGSRAAGRRRRKDRRLLRPRPWLHASLLRPRRRGEPRRSSPAPARVVSRRIGRRRRRRQSSWQRRRRTGRSRSSSSPAVKRRSAPPTRPRPGGRSSSSCARSASSRSRTARSVQGWLMRDPEASSPQPLLLDIHGGPHNAWNGAADSIAPLPPGARGARLGGAAAESTRQRRVRRGLLPGGSRGVGRRPTRGTSSSRSTRSSRTGSPTRIGSP